MRIIIDGDATPREVRKICEQESKERKINLVLVCSFDHEISEDYEIIKVSKGNDAADYKIVEIFEKGDLLITQDYGLASLVLNKSTAVINPSGYLYTKKNIDNLLHTRYIGQKIRKGGGKTKGPSKRKKEDDEVFKNTLRKILDDNDI